MGNFQPGAEFASHLDQIDPLKEYKNRFYFPEENIIYLDGNSLGRLPLKSVEVINDVVRNQWGERLIRSWNENWLDIPKRTASKIAGIIGAQPEEIILCDSTSLNLYKLLLAALEMNKNRFKIISDDLNFPSDLYIIKSVIKLLNSGHELATIQSRDGIYPDTSQLDLLLDEKASVLTLSHVLFKSSYLYDMKQITKQAHEKGALVIWDLSHSAGVVPIKLNEWNVDFAIGCTYKYINGGPGSNAFLYVRKDLIDQVSNYINGWLGSENPFEFDNEFREALGIEKFVVSTPQILSMSAIEPAVDIIIEAGMENIRKKSILMTEYFSYLFTEKLSPLQFEFGSPAESNCRGSHISLKHIEANRICKTLINSKNISKNVIPDFRMPDNIRFGFSPLYNSFTEIFDTVEITVKIIESGEFENYSNDIYNVT